MYFDFEDYRPDIEPVGRAISWRDGVFLSIAVHAVMLVLLIFGPRLLPAWLLQPRPSPTPLSLQPERQTPRFVFMSPRLDMQAKKPPPRAELSDRDREARTIERAPIPTNPLPLSRGNTPDRVESPQQDRLRQQAAEAQAKQAQQQAAAQAQQATNVPHVSDLPSALEVPPAQRQQPAPNNAAERSAVAGSGALGNALKDLRRYIPSQNFDNPGGGGQFGPAIQFDSKGVEFGPWIRRFVAQIRHNWFIPEAAMSMKGHVVITFNVHKDGSISDLTVVGPCPIDSFNTSAFGALASSNPTQPLPPEYPADKAFFTVTFYYNESPP